MAETPPPVQGQPTPESNASSQQGSFPPGNEFGASSVREVAGMMNKGESADTGQPVSVDEWTRRAQAAEETKRTLTGGESTEDAEKRWGFFEKPQSEFLSGLNNVQKEELVAGTLTYIQDVLGIKDVMSSGPEGQQALRVIGGFLDKVPYRENASVWDEIWRKLSPTRNPGLPPTTPPPQKPVQGN